MTDQLDSVLERIDAQRDAHLETLKEYLRIPSISTDPAHDDDVRRCAEFVRDRMVQAGLVAECIEASSVGRDKGHPLVYGEWLGAPGKPTVLFYGHYDVQPPDPLEEWRNPPFEPTVEGTDLVARGATDDKGQSLTHLLAVETMLAERGSLPVNVKFLVEGEEESGGETIEAFVEQDGADRLACDCVVVSDTSMFGPGQPSLLYGLKGMLYTEILVSGPARDLHSGSFGGGVRNPLNALAQIIAQLRDPDTGEVKIPGFYDDVRPLEPAEREAFAALPFDEAAYQAELDVPELFGEQGFSTLERVWGRPTCDVNGIWGGYQGVGAKTVIAAQGGAKVSMRLVPDQDPKKIARQLESYIEEIAPSGTRVTVRILSGGTPVVIDTSGPFPEASMDALEQVWGKRPVKVREGGSIPIVTTFSRVLEAPILLMGFGLPDDRLHSPNEKMNIEHFHKGIQTIAAFLDRVAAV